MGWYAKWSRCPITTSRRSPQAPGKSPCPSPRKFHPSLRVAGFDCRVWYVGQPSVCPICRKPGHRVKQCPDQGKCRRCHQPGHVARQCRRAWGAASAAPSGSSARSEATPPIPAPVPAVRSAEPLIVEMESCSESESSLVAGDLEVAASAPPGPVSPRRTRSKGKARSPKPLEDRDSQVAGEHHSAPRS